MKPSKEKTMEAIYLQSMTDFVLKIDGIVKQPEDQDTDDWSLSCFSVIENYANFLKQPLQLGFFVPCDENGNVLEEPKHISETKFNMFDEGGLYKAYSDNLKLYIQAKERVLFKGFSIRTENKRKYVSMEGYEIERSLLSGHKMTIEDLANDWSHIELTESAIKQIGL